MIIGAIEVTVRSGPGTPRVLELGHQQVLVHGGEPEAAVLRRPVQPEPALFADLAAERRQLAALVLEPVLGHLGPQRGRDVLVEELPHFGHPCALGVVELEVHAGDTIEKLSTRRANGSCVLSKLRVMTDSAEFLTQVAFSRTAGMREAIR